MNDVSTFHHCSCENLILVTFLNIALIRMCLNIALIRMCLNIALIRMCLNIALIRMCKMMESSKMRQVQLEYLRVSGCFVYNLLFYNFTYVVMNRDLFLATLPDPLCLFGTSSS